MDNNFNIELEKRRGVKHVKNGGYSQNYIQIEGTDSNNLYGIQILQYIPSNNTDYSNYEM